jgi:hypothetical protein
MENISMNKAASSQTLPYLKPLRFEPGFEQPEADEADVIRQTSETMGKIREKTFADSGHAIRSVHAKSHGLLRGTLTVSHDLPAAYAQGLFEKTGQYPLLMRLSSTPGDILPDQVSTPRGCALKIIGVQGDRLPDSQADVTQDFVLVNGGPTFQVANLKRFLANLKLLAATADKAEGAKVIVSTAMKAIEKGIEALGSTSAKIRNMGGEPETHILGESFFSQVPVLFGPYYAKVVLVPVSDGLRALTGAPLPAGDNPLVLREAVLDYFRIAGGEWELRAQLATDLDQMPIEDASVEWPEDQSPYVTVADGMAFSPWHGLAAHRPLGSIMRGRRVAYLHSARFRAEHNGKPVAEPRNLEQFPD